MTRMSGYAAVCMAALFIVSFVACGSSDSGDSQSSGGTSTAEANVETHSISDPAGDIEGVWLGVGYIDEDLLAQKIEATQDAQLKADLQAMANTLKSMRVGVSFNDDTSYQMEIQLVATNGQVRAGASQGSWKIVSSDRESVVVEETDVDTQAVEQKTYTFVDSDHVALVPPVAEILLDCNPLIVFERQTGVDLNDAATETTAQSPDGLQR